jgi:ribose transport system ATP-binding protein/rhamnose transport system ATP-binding protein
MWSAAGRRPALGENGAGKSTLGKIVAGVYRPDAGTVALDGVPLRDLDEAAAGALGIGIVHQEGSLVRQLSVAENVFAGRQPTRRLGTIDRRAMRGRTRELLDTLGVAIDPATPVRELSPAQAQVVEIAKALSRDLRLLILDEPTAALTLSETGRLFAVVSRLATAGVAVVYISHRLAEIFELCDRVTVLKGGRVTGTREVARTSEDELIRLMVGREVAFASAPARPCGERLLEVRGLQAPPFVRHADLDLHAGEIVCLAGLVGSGRTELGEAVFGARRPAAGTVRVRGQEARFRGPFDAVAAGLGMVPEDRKEASLFLAADIGMTVLDGSRRASSTSGGRRSWRGASSASSGSRPPRPARRWARSRAATSRRCCSPSGWRASPPC